MFVRAFGGSRKPSTLSRREWDRFINDRRNGRIAPKHAKRRHVGNRQIAYDLSWLLAVLNWACLSGDGAGNALLERNPLKGLPLPRTESPRRPVVTDERYEKLRAVAESVHPRFQLELSNA